MASVSLLHSTSPRTLRRRSYWTTFSRSSHPWLRTFGILLSVGLLLEIGVRVLEYATDLPLDDARSAAKCKLAPGALLGGRTINSSGYWDSDFTDASASGEHRRVAVLGGLSTLAGDADTNFTTQLERLVPDLEVDHFGLPDAGPREYAAQVVHDILRRRPKRVMICLDATTDFMPHDSQAHRLDCRALQLAESLLAPATATAVDSLSPLRLTETLGYDEYVRRRAATVAASRKSANAEQDQRRRDAQNAFERLVRVCRKRNIPVTLVLLPGEFQLSSQLTAAFCRRMQYDPAELDLELPQRRWSALAEHLQVATIDLLPALREKGEIVYQPNSSDWNDRGQTIVAETIARDLNNRGI
ncbi:MAG: hypothetical protein K8U03_12190 [Planctomycetia bacterium]|nr:hypothetical protein [Planctomycetia bacterium]